MRTILLIILALILPPLAAFLIVGLSTHFWINLILTLLGWAARHGPRTLAHRQPVVEENCLELPDERVVPRG